MDLNEALNKLNKAGFICEDVDITFEDFINQVWNVINNETTEPELMDPMDKRRVALVNFVIKDYYDNEYWPNKSIEDNIDDCIQKIVAKLAAM